MQHNCLLIREDVGQVLLAPLPSLPRFLHWPGDVCVREHHSLRHMHWEQVKRTSLSDIHGDMTFGYKRPPDAEGAEISAWPPHKGFVLHYTVQPRQPIN